jgi:alpha-glucosidase
MFDVTRWWYDRGVSGFRLDAVDTLFEDPQLRDNPILPGKDAYGDQNQDRIYNTNLPEIHDVLRGLRKIADKSGAVLIGETWTKDVSQLRQYYGDHGDELQMPMDLMFTQLKFSAPVFREHVAAVDAAGGWPVYVISNHDIARAYDRYGDGRHNDEIAKVMAALYLTLRGTPVMYYGEEIGMKTTPPTRKEDVKDPIGRAGWPNEKGRDGERTPMQWNSNTNAGFSSKTPWLPVPPTYKTYNVESEAKDPNSILNMYKKLLAVRHANQALLDGAYTALNESDADVMSYLRSYKGKAVLVALNMSASPKKAKFDLAGQGFASASLTSLVSTPKSAAKGGEVSLEPFGVFIGEVTR